jgi:hypothetical protein
MSSVEEGLLGDSSLSASDPSMAATPEETEELIKVASGTSKTNQLYVNREATGKRQWVLLHVGIVVAVIVGALVFVTRGEVLSSSSTQMSSTEFTQTSFQIQRAGYDLLPYFQADYNSILTYKIFEGFDGVVEPYANTTVYFTGELSDDIHYQYTLRYNDEVTYRGYIMSSDDGTNSTLNAFTVPCQPRETVAMSVEKYANDVLSEELDMSLLCMYVRREVRRLQQEDKEAAVRAMFQLWALGEEEGQAMHGQNFHNVDWFVKAHDFNAAWMDGDHFHEGLGFVPQHIKLTNWYESSVQAVDPSTSLFYWDFTIDVAEGMTIDQTPIFQNDTFGELKLPKNLDLGWSYELDSINDGAIPTGLWANWEASPAFFEDLQSPYGYTRGPWNMNPSKSIVRYSLNAKSNPSCSAYYNWLTDTKFTSFMATSENAPHGSVHGNVGGVFGCDLLDDLIDEGILDSDSRGSVCSKWGFYLKEM